MTTLTERPVTFVHLYVHLYIKHEVYKMPTLSLSPATNIWQTSKLDRSPAQSELLNSFNNSELHNVTQSVTGLRVNGQFSKDCSIRNDYHIDGMEIDSNRPRVLNTLNNKTQNGEGNFRSML
jgi:hypothetical protein